MSCNATDATCRVYAEAARALWCAGVDCGHTIFLSHIDGRANSGQVVHMMLGQLDTAHKYWIGRVDHRPLDDLVFQRGYAFSAHNSRWTQRFGR